MTKLAVCIVAMNEEKTILSCLNSVIPLNPDSIWFFDGPWKNGEPGDKSSDNTKLIFSDFKEYAKNLNGIKCHWIDNRILYDNESEKRNRALKIIEDTYGIEDHLWILIIDGDEEIILPYGPKKYDLSHDLIPFEHGFCCKIRTYLYNEPKAFLDGVRIIPGNKESIITLKLL